jgi:hypothetical protein
VSLLAAVTWLVGCGTGYAIGHRHGWDAHTAADKISNGVRSQMRKVRDNLRFAGEGFEATSHATVTTIDGEFEVIVRQPVPTTDSRRGE